MDRGVESQQVHQKQNGFLFLFSESRGSSSCGYAMDRGVESLQVHQKQNGFLFLISMQ
jgi:hypothetical protein